MCMIVHEMLKIELSIFSTHANSHTVGDKIFVVEQYLVISWILFSWLLLALQVKVDKVASFMGKIFVVRPSTTKTMNILPHGNYPLYCIHPPTFELC